MKPDISPVLQDFLREVPDLVAVYLYGSVARGTARPDSDLDLAVLARRPIDRHRLFRLAGRVTAAEGRICDLVDLTNPRMSAILRHEVISDGSLLLDLEPTITGRYEDFFRVDYLDLLEDRKEIDAAIGARGQVYAN